VIRSTCERVHLEAITIRIALGKTRACVKTKTTPTKLKVATPRQNPSAVRTAVTGSEVVATRDLTGVVHVLSFFIARYCRRKANRRIYCDLCVTRR
jgi:hypothetical protein